MNSDFNKTFIEIIENNNNNEPHWAGNLLKYLSDIEDNQFKQCVIASLRVQNTFTFMMGNNKFKITKL